MILLVAAAALAVIGLRYANLSLLEQRLVDIRELPDSVVSAGFSLSSDREIEIDISGVGQVRQVPNRDMPVFANLDNVWLIDARTKEAVWKLNEASAIRGANGSVAFDGAISLPEGQYILTCLVKSEQTRQQSTSWVSWLDGNGATQNADVVTDGQSR